MPRKSRVTETRAGEMRTNNKRSLPGNRYREDLYVDPNTIPKGMVYAWVRETIVGMDDPTNVTKRQIRGWSPVPSSRHPELVPPALPGREHLQQSIIRYGGLILMEKPKHLVEEMREEMREENAVTIRSIQNFTDHADPLLPKADYGSGVQIERVTARFKD